MNKGRRWLALGLGALFAGLMIWFYLWKHGEASASLSIMKMGKEFWYQVLYTVLILTFGIRVILKYKDPYTTKRTLSVMFFQLLLGLLIPYLLPEKLGGRFPGSEDPNDTGFTIFLFRLWPLESQALIFNRALTDYVAYLKDQGNLAAANTLTHLIKYYLWYAIGIGVIAMPIAVYFLGKRVYCSWSCACGGLAETFGDFWRHRAPKGRVAEAFEYVIYPMVVWVIWITIAGLIVKDFTAFSEGRIEPYQFWGDFILGAIIGVGLYPIVGSRPWCRYFCPWAGLFGLIALKGRFAIKVEKNLCMACGQCNHICEMGIDIRKSAMNNKDVKTATCVGCGACVVVCPRKVLSLAPVFEKDWMKELEKKAG